MRIDSIVDQKHVHRKDENEIVRDAEVREQPVKKQKSTQDGWGSTSGKPKSLLAVSGRKKYRKIRH